MPDIQPDEEASLSRAIVQTCDDIVLRLTTLATPGTTRSQFKYMRACVSSLSSLLKTISALGITYGTCDAVKDCHMALVSIKESLSHTPAIYRETSAFQMRSLIDAHNNLSLRLNSQHIADEAGLKTLKLGLDNLSREAIAATDSFFSNQTPSHEGKGRFTVSEREIIVSNRNMIPRLSYEIICPRAEFGTISGYMPSSRKTIKFICCCEDLKESHDTQLRYREVEKLPGPSELVRPGMERTWQMLLHKKSKGAIVSVRLTGVVPAFIPEVQEWIVNRAFRWIITHNLKKDPDNTGSSYAVSTPDSLLLRTAVYDEDLLRNKVPRQIVVHAPQGDVHLDLKLIDMQACYFSRASWDDIKSGSERASPPSRLLLPQPWASFLFNTGQTSPAQPHRDNSLTVDVFIKSIIVSHTNHSKGLSWVGLSGVQVHQGQVTIKGDVSLKFSRVEDAETFAHQVYQMRLWLLQGFTQGAFLGESEAYIQDSGALSRFSESSRTRISVISSKQAGSKKPEMRMLIMRDGFSGSICLDFGTNILQVSKTGLQNSQGLIRFFCHYYDDRGVPTTVETNWHKLVSQQRDTALVWQTQSLGGPQIVRWDKTLITDTGNQTRTAEDWLSTTDHLRDIMTSCDQQDKYDRVRICVIDTGLREDYGLSCSAFRDFVDPENMTVCDKSTSGHGTLCAHIILSVFDQCELYVARVFADDNAEDRTGSARMADAIEWAVSKEVRADIISISAGFREESPRLEEAVRKASAENKLIFASASNWGNVDGVAFPARHPATICIYSTNTADKPSDFNPEPRAHAHNFALLGEGWQSYVDPQKYERGTSMATAAAAGLAALILDFSRQGGNNDTAWGSQVHQISGMVAIFHSISKPAGRFRCVEPKHLLADYGLPAAAVAAPSRDRQRAWVEYKIKDTMMRKSLGIFL